MHLDSASCLSPPASRLPFLMCPGQQPCLWKEGCTPRCSPASCPSAFLHRLLPALHMLHHFSLLADMLSVCSLMCASPHPSSSRPCNPLQWSGSSGDDSQLPERIGSYHSLAPLEELRLTEDGRPPSVLGVRSTVVKAISSSDGAAYVLRVINGKQVGASGRQQGAPGRVFNAWAPSCSCMLVWLQPWSGSQQKASHPHHACRSPQRWPVMTTLQLAA
jgi:hypothetical protein